MAGWLSLHSRLTALVSAVAVTTAPAALAASETGDNSNKAAPENSGKSDSSDSSENSRENPNSDENSGEEPVATNVPEKKTLGTTDKSYGHQGQFHVRLALGASYRIVMRYDESPLCSDGRQDDGTPRKFCGFGSPLTLDTAVGYAPLGGIEPFLWGRFGLTKESVSNTSPLVILGAGVRLYTMSDAAFKFFIEPAVGMEFENGAAAKSDGSWVTPQGDRVRYKQDFIVRLTIGPQLDFSRNFGAYAAAGLTVGMLRSLQSWMDVHFGVQARFP